MCLSQYSLFWQRDYNSAVICFTWWRTFLWQWLSHLSSTFLQHSTAARGSSTYQLPVAHLMSNLQSKRICVCVCVCAWVRACVSQLQLFYNSPPPPALQNIFLAARPHRHSHPDTRHVQVYPWQPHLGFVKFCVFLKKTLFSTCWLPV